MSWQSFVSSVLPALVCGAFVVIPERDSAADVDLPVPALAARAVVEAVNALVPSDIAIPAAASAACALERLPASREGLLPLVPAEHRALVEECVRGRLRFERRIVAFDPLEMLEEPADAEGPMATVREFFSGRPVDVACGAGMSEGPYPVSFDWALVLDPRSRTVFSFVLNCRD